jgi:MarR family transcriptional regulator for hemolysin
MPKSDTTQATRSHTANGVTAPVPPRSSRGSDENWDQRLGFLMHDVSRLRRTVFDDFMKPLKVTRSQWWVLAYLSRHDGMIQSDLANVLELGKAALGSLIDRLEAAGLVRRGADESDRRAKRVYLSPAGSHLIKEMHVLSNEMSERILEGIDDASRHSLANMLSQVKANLLAISESKDLVCRPAGPWRNS